MLDSKTEKAIEGLDKEQAVGYLRALEDLTDEVSHILYRYDKESESPIILNSEYMIRKQLINFVRQKEAILRAAKPSVPVDSSKNSNQPD